MKAVTSDNNKHISSIIEPIKDTKIVTNKVEQSKIILILTKINKF